MEKPLAGQKIGLAGLGNMGRAPARHLHEAGAEMEVWNRSDAPAQALRLAELSGVDPVLVREALLGGFAESRILDLRGSRMVRRDFARGGRATLQLKDVRLNAGSLKASASIHRL
jgi:2-hydroxy-3-oxopropionate reductase